ncbi:transcriptional regulator with XRE-family HTH domain [Microvirga flocculans]|uniref:Transcriptional regulator with XRE-family HTH domain n=1 Tax=Microvirga flocculans TaxID=217168 RepID=A0A7W6N7N2_9HYPH|nr:transcriptional regulator with XRE-family HTH domain [Microvirga flocculans]
MNKWYAKWTMKSTVPAELLQQVRERMLALRLTQESVAKACRLSQPHLSKVLSGKIAPGRKTRLLLERWLARAAPEASGGEAEALERIIQELLASRPERRMQIMQLLRLIQTLAQ